MLNPKIVIESDGERSDVFIDGKLVEHGKYCEFKHIAGESVSWKVLAHKTDKNGLYFLENGEVPEELVDKYPKE